MTFASAIEQIGYHPLEDRPGFKLAMQEVEGRFFLYVAHLWEARISVLDVTEPTKPRLLHAEDGPGNTWSHQVQVAGGRMVTNLEHRLPNWGLDPDGPDPQEGLCIWDVASDPARPRLLGTWRGGGNGTHRNYYTGGRYVHATASMKGYRGKVYACIDIADPAIPTTVGIFAMPGQRPDEAESERYKGKLIDLHGPAYVVGDRAYCSWSSAGLVILDVSQPTAPRLLGQLDVNPPLGSRIALHTAVPLPDRDLVILNSEALRECCDEPLNFAGLASVAQVEDPRLISLFPLPEVPEGYPWGDFVERGARFGPHNQHHPQGHPALLPSDRYVYLTYFNAGLQVYDIANPYFPKIAGYFIPDDPSRRLGPLPTTGLVTQIEDVLVDRRGVAYLTEKNSGLYVVRFDGHAHLWDQ